ncbi:hypothetical protein LCGC14_1575650 [marine sediment metagenome]|uniref:Uncharacterized protein n=1 Tax=marine sediment metagenome TaxID=412755 RepID=A0A0F9IIH4_9ZZZZ
MKWIRPTVIILLALAMVAGFWLDRIEAAVFVPFATGLIIYWFKSRDEKNGG